MELKEWYGAKTVYSVSSNTVKDNMRLYEERVVILKAKSFDDAIKEAEEEAFEYANEEIGIVYLGYVNVFKIADKKVKNKMEVFSLMRESNLTANKYLDKHFDTGTERTK